VASMRGRDDTAIGIVDQDGMSTSKKVVKKQLNENRSKSKSRNIEMRMYHSDADRFYKTAIKNYLASTYFNKKLDERISFKK